MITREDIISLFKEFLDQIKDEVLREKVVQTWLAGCEQGKWSSVEQLKQMPFTLLTSSLAVNFIDHTLAVIQGALALARAQQTYYTTMPYAIHFDWLIAGALLHDVGKLLEFESDGAGGFRVSANGKFMRHPVSGAILAAQNGLPPAIINMIVCHSKEGEGRHQRIETIFIHQADFATFDPLVMLEKGKLILEEAG